VDSHKDGDIITGRPWIMGRAYMVAPDDNRRLSRREAAAIYGVNRIDLSFDNGRTFNKARAIDNRNYLDGTNWRYRLETSELDSGTLPIIIRAIFENGQVAVRRVLLTVDAESPVVNTIGPSENSAHRDTIMVHGSTTDQYTMDTVLVRLRPGDKIGYSVPAFVQGMYFDFSFLGGFTWATGLGFTFFNDNVKVQGNVAQAPPGRYSGWAFGGKVLANIYRVNLSRWLGLDWQFWQTSIVLGAHFSVFMMEEGQTPVVMGQFLGQWEIIKADMNYFFPKWKYFKSLSLYLEPGIWFAPSDVTEDPMAWRTMFTIGIGLRTSLF